MQIADAIFVATNSLAIKNSKLNKRRPETHGRTADRNLATTAAAGTCIELAH